MEYFKSVVFGLVSPLVPRMSEMEGQANRLELRRLFLRATRAATLLSMFIGSMFILDGQSLLGVWLGARFRGTYTLLLVLTIGYMAMLAQFPSNVVIYALGRHQPLGWWTLAEGALNLILSIYWARQLGLVGVALGTTLPMLVTGLLVQPWYVLRLLRFPAGKYLREALARPVLTCAVFLTLCHFIGSPQVRMDPLKLLIDLAWQSSLFAVLAYSLGVRASERREILQRYKQWRDADDERRVPAEAPAGQAVPKQDFFRAWP